MTAIPRLNVAIGSDKCPEIGLGNPDSATQVVRNEFATLDPAADCPGADSRCFGNLLDREEFRDLGAAAIHHSSSRISEVERIGFPSRASIH
jgi:hypothetical protein